MRTSAPVAAAAAVATVLAVGTAEPSASRAAGSEPAADALRLRVTGVLGPALDAASPAIPAVTQTASGRDDHLWVATVDGTVIRWSVHKQAIAGTWGSAHGRRLGDLRPVPAVGATLSRDVRLDVTAMVEQPNGELVIAVTGGWIVTVRSRGDLVVSATDTVAADVATDHEGRIVVASALGVTWLGSDRKIRVTRPAGGPDSIGFDSAGALYMLDNHTAAVWVRDAGGRVSLLGRIETTRVVTKRLTVLGRGDVAVADVGGGRVWRVQPGRVTVIAGDGRSGFGPDGAPPLQTVLGDAVDVDVLHGNLLVTEANPGVVRSVSGPRVRTMVGSRHRLVYPAGVSFAPNGEILVSSPYADFVASFGAGDRVLRRRPSRMGIQDVLAHPDGSVWVTDQVRRVVLRYTADDAEPTVVLGGGTTAPEMREDVRAATAVRLMKPAGLAVMGDGSVVVTDVVAARIYVVQAGRAHLVAGGARVGFSPDGTVAAGGAISAPTGVAVDGEGRVVFVEGGNYRVRRIESDYTLRTLVGNGASDRVRPGADVLRTAMDNPNDVAVLPDGTVCWTELRHGVFCSVRNSVVSAIGSPLRPPAGSAVPERATDVWLRTGGSLAVSGDELAVTDPDAGRVYMFRIEAAA